MMKRHAIFISVLFLLMLIIPFLAMGGTDPGQASPPENSSQTTEGSSPSASPAVDAESFRILDETTGEIVTVSNEEFAIGGVAAEMPPTFEPEALKAQAVLVRTDIYRQIQTGGNKEAVQGNFWNREEMQEAWGGKDGIYYRKFQDAWQETEGQILTWQGQPAYVPFFRLSIGCTRDGKEVFHSADYGYLKSVESSQDREAPDYVNSTYVSASQLPARLVIKKRDSAGYVTALTADGSWLEGESFREGMHLASADFSMQKVGNAVRFLCKGKGHGLGFSQYGGNEMAKEGSSWEEILEAYFPEMELQNINSV